MSELLMSSIPPRSALWSISQIDQECEEAPASQDIQVCRGPFGAFRLAQGQLSSDPDPPKDMGSPPEVIQADTDQIFPSDGALVLTPRTQLLLDTIFDQNPPSPILDLGAPIGNDFMVSEALQLPMASIPHSIAETSSSQPLSIPPSIDSSVPLHAVFLLKHYTTTVLGLLTPYRHSKTPWHVLFIPHAKNCLAALTLGEEVDHASLCVFYSTLAISAFSLVGVSQTQTWLGHGKAYKQQAREHVRLMLKTAYDVPKKAKYKSILMALLTMVQVSIMSGSRDQTECYFLEAEKFIRVKGLNRQKSRKVRLLHHCYAYERMFYESTVIGATDSIHRHHVRKAIESSGAVAHSIDGLSFRLSLWDNLEQDMLRAKGAKESENDLHLQLPGAWSKTLYPEIFGVPEPYLILLSLTIRLGREKELVEQNGAGADGEGGISLQDFTRCAKSLERCINQIKRFSQDEAFLTTTARPIPQNELENTLEAMQHALAIYFYRRIYDVDAALLLPKVVGVRDCLLRFRGDGNDNGNDDNANVYGSARLIWPAFIAACEAEDPDVQASFAAWFRDSARRSGLRLFGDRLADVERFWEDKRRATGAPGGGNVTWLGLMRKNMQPVG